MARHQSQSQSQGGSSGFAHYRGNGLSGSATAQSASDTRSGQYRPQNDPNYRAVDRPLQNFYGHLESVTHDPTFRMEPHPSYGVLHVPSNGGDARGSSLGNRPSVPHPIQTQPGEASRGEFAGYSPYVRHILYPAPGHNRDDPYNAVGYIRRDGRVFDNDESYQEYRRDGQVERLEGNGSDAWTHVRSGARR